MRVELGLGPELGPFGLVFGPELGLDWPVLAVNCSLLVSWPVQH